MNRRPPLLSIALISAALLAYEICLMHLFAVIHFHHFAYMVISLALLGYGASGSFLAVGEGWLHRYHGLVYWLCLMLFGVSAPLAFQLGQGVPFNGLELFWDLHQSLYLALLLLLFIIPFFFGALAIGIILSLYRREVGRVYGFDLVGAGLGCLAVVWLLWLVTPTGLVTIISTLGLLAAATSLFELSLPRRWAGAVLCLVLCGVLAAGNLGQSLRPSPYKPLQQALQVAGTTVEKELFSPFGVLTVVDSPLVPFRHAPGISLVSLREPLPQKAVFTNGDGLSVITMGAAHRGQLDYLDQMTSALPYHLRQAEKVLILGLGGGQDVLQARYHHIPEVTAVELNPQMVDLLSHDYAEYSGNLLAGGLRVHVGDFRDYLQQSREHFDLIQLALVDSFLPSAAGLHALRENYLYTIEAIGESLDRLGPRGMVAITRWLKNPPRDSLKLVATATEALRLRGVDMVAEHLVLIRGWQTSTLIVSREKFAAEEIGRLRTFCRQRSFDIVHGPGVESEAANRYNLLSEPTLANGVRALMGEDAAAFIAAYKYNLTPARDDRPYFHHFFKWSSGAELLRLRHSGGAALLESGYLVLVVVLCIAVMGAVLLILSPLLFLPRKGRDLSLRGDRKWLVVYFFATGLAFMMVEIACIQKFMRFLHHPVYAVSVVVASFLVFAGIGSMATQRLTGNGYRPHTLLGVAVAMIVLFALLYLLLAEQAFSALAHLGLPARLALAVLAIAPLALFMGMPFSLALSRLPPGAAAPWAWGINGCASVIGSMAATLLAMQYGFNVVLAVAVALYLVVAGSFPLVGRSFAFTAGKIVSVGR
jgi:hypothetical protein